MRPLLVLVLVLAASLPGAVRAQPAGQPAPAQARAVALLPLDADQQLAIYGQPVASELARALGAGGVDVVVVGPKMAVPERARLIVDGTIRAKGEAVVLSVRVRDVADGTVLATLDATAPKLTSIDKAAAQLSARVLPAVTELLAKQQQAAHARPQPAPGPAAPAAPAPEPLLVAVIAAPGTPPATAPLRDALAHAVDAWAEAHHRTVVAVDAAALASSKALAAHHGTLGVLFEIEGYAVDPGVVPLARARVHVRVVQPAGFVDGAVGFDRVIVTDTIVGDRGLSADALAARAAREVLAIAEPHVRRVVASWR